MRIAVTGGSGKLGRAVVAHLAASGNTVVNLDAVGERAYGIVRVDLTDYGQTVDALAGVDGQHGGIDALVHLAAIPAPGILSDVATFHNNMSVTFNVLHAARRLGIRNIVAASSETVLGLPFDTPPPYLPVDEEYAARPESVYSLVKHLEEQLAVELTRWDPGLKIISLRFSNVMNPEDYEAFPGYNSDPASRKWNLWGYIDARDGAQAVEKALALDKSGHDTFIIAAADTVMTIPNDQLVQAAFPDVPVHGDLGVHESLLSIAKARRVLDFEPRYSWRDAGNIPA
ncbi:MAG: UDP-glucose 4-epimerase [Cryobacterium sp.]|jgi:nucleoside-diphosphate-sugar epimerase|nr:UDP-glucose 4-epimerase [Cryobacterium sp.]